MKIRAFVVLLAALLLLVLVTAVSAHGLDTDTLTKAGWGCMIAGDHGWVHCFPPGSPMEKGKATTVKVFDCKEPDCTDEGGGDFSGVGHPFLGTELLIHESVYHGQPCMTDGGEAYHSLAPVLPFYACHHFDTHE
jgi:hypothetical protein